MNETSQYERDKVAAAAQADQQETALSKALAQLEALQAHPLWNVRNGALVHELKEALAQLTEAVLETGKKGKLTLTLELAPLGKSDERAVQLNDVLKAALPLTTKASTLFFADQDFSLTRESPRQPQLPFKAPGVTLTGTEKPVFDQGRAGERVDAERPDS